MEIMASEAGDMQLIQNSSNGGKQDVAAPQEGAKPLQAQAAAGAMPKKLDPWSDEALAKLPRHVRTKQRALISDEKRLSLKAIVFYELWAWWQWIFCNIPGRVGWVIRPIVYKPFFKHIGKHAHIADGVSIRYPESIELGDYSILSHGCIVSGQGGVKIGSYGGLAPYSIVESATHSGFEHDRLGIFRGMEAAPVTIGESVWIGAGSFVTPGTTIGDGAIVGAGAVVTHDIPDYIVCAGVPAKPLAHRRPPSGKKPVLETELAEGKKGWLGLHRRSR